MTAPSVTECYLEHANITVKDIDDTVNFLQTAFPHFQIRGGGELDINGLQKRWCHIGTQTTYVALEEVKNIKSEETRCSYRDVGINHIGFVVPNIDEIIERLSNAGFREGYKAGNHQFRKRRYFYDSSNTEFEFIQYLSDKYSERNDYST